MKDKTVEKLYIYNNHLDLIYYSYNIIKKFPKYEKDCLHQEIRNILLSIYKNIISAYEQSNNILKVGILKEMKTNIKILELYIRISYKEKYISSKNYAAWSKKIYNVSRHLENWLLACQKKTKIKYDDVLTFEKLYEAFYRARKGKVLKREVIKFEQNLEINLVNIYEQLSNLTYKVAPYKSFTILEPKERLIKTLPLKDRVIHQWYVEEFLKKYMVPRFINDTYACIKDRGTHKSYKKILKYMREMRSKYGSCYIIKLDIRKYFFNIDRKILYDILCRRFKDKKFLELSKIII